MDLKKFCLPDTISVGGHSYKIKTSFKYWLRFYELIEKSYNPFDFDFLYEEEKPEDKKQGLVELGKFCTPQKKLPKGKSTGEKILDYSIDADFIFSAFYQQYKIDLIESDMHWYKFTALVRGLKDTKLNDIMQFRTYETDGSRSAYDKNMMERKQAWSLEDNSADEDLIAFEKLLR